VATIVTQTEVERGDPAFQNPSKPIGGFMTEEEAERRRVEEGWQVRRRRRARLAPRRRLAAADPHRRRGGGEGADQRRHRHHHRRRRRHPGRRRRCRATCMGTAAVIDKDLASALLANVIGADMLIISTAVEKVALYYGKPDQQWLDRMTLAEAKAYLAEGRTLCRRQHGAEDQGRD
jgi:carbamate kinase